MKTDQPLFLNEEQVREYLRMTELIPAMEKALRAADAKVLAILGSGVQARSHVEALRLVRQFEESRVWSPTFEHAKRFATEIGATAMSAEEAVRGADVIVTVTSSKTPILNG